MNDMTSVIVPKSDQWNADDFLSGPRTFTIRDVQIKGGQEQPVNILLEGSDKAYRPCKSMSRCLVHAWGADANNYRGRSLTLYCDPKVKWGGMQVGGIRISHMSHIERELQMALTETKGRKAPFTVKPLKVADQTKTASRPAETPIDTSKPPALIHVPQLADGKGADWIAWLKLVGAAIDAAPTAEWLNGLVTENQAAIGGLRDASEKQYGALMAKVEARRVALTDAEIPFE